MFFAVSVAGFQKDIGIPQSVVIVRKVFGKAFRRKIRTVQNDLNPVNIDQSLHRKKRFPPYGIGEFVFIRHDELKVYLVVFRADQFGSDGKIFFEIVVKCGAFVFSELFVTVGDRCLHATYLLILALIINALHNIIKTYSFA